MGMEGKTTWTKVSDTLQWLQDWLIVIKHGCCSGYEEPRQECLINMHRRRKKKKVDKGLKSRWKGSSASFPNLLPVLRAVEWLQEEIVGIGVRLCFICCPLQGGSNLQPAHDPINPNACPLNLNPRKLFLSWPGSGQAMALSVGHLTDEVTGFIDRGSHLCWKRLGFWFDALQRGRGRARGEAPRQLQRHDPLRARHPRRSETLSEVF